MKKLNEQQLNNIANKFIQDNRDKLDISNDKIEIAKQIYNTVMNNECNKDKPLDIQEDMFRDILMGKGTNEDERFIYTRYSDTKHLEYLDVFAGAGETQKLLDIFRENNIPIDVLKKIKFNLNMNGDKERTNAGTVEITQHFTDSPPELEYFEVKLNGKSIYTFEGKVEEQFKLDKKELTEDEKYYTNQQRSIKEEAKRAITERRKRNNIKSKSSRGIFSMVRDFKTSAVKRKDALIVEKIEFAVKNKMVTRYRDPFTGRFISTKGSNIRMF